MSRHLTIMRKPMAPQRIGLRWTRARITRQLIRLGSIIVLLLCLSSVPTARMQDDGFSLIWQQVATQPEDFAVGCERLDSGRSSIQAEAQSSITLMWLSRSPRSPKS